jgi:predicted DNA-binding protein YlxM (UPF0122 family)
VRHIDLFSGAVSGFSFAASRVWPDCEHVALCEVDPWRRKQLNRLWPGVPIIEDINDFTVDMLCQLLDNGLSLKQENDMVRKDYSGAAEMYDKGFSIGEIANYYMVSRQAMWKILQRRGVIFRPNLRYGEENHFYRGGSLKNDRVANMVQIALNNGALTKSPCEQCKLENVEGHHDDYNKPLIVRWLCKEHHFDWHKKNRAIELHSTFPSMEHHEISILGGQSSWKNLTPEQRAERSKKMSDARWKKGGAVGAKSEARIDLLTASPP